MRGDDLGQFWQQLGEHIRLIAGRLEQVIARLPDHSLQAGHVEADHPAGLLADAAADDDRVPVAALSRLHNRSDCVVRRVKVDIVRPDHQKVGLLSRRQRADLVVEPSAVCTAHGGAMEHIPHHERLGRILIAGEPAVLRHGTLDLARWPVTATRLPMNMSPPYDVSLSTLNPGLMPWFHACCSAHTPSPSAYCASERGHTLILAPVSTKACHVFSGNAPQ